MPLSQEDLECIRPHVEAIRHHISTMAEAGKSLKHLRRNLDEADYKEQLARLGMEPDKDSDWINHVIACGEDAEAQAQSAINAYAQAAAEYDAWGSDG